MVTFEEMFASDRASEIKISKDARGIEFSEDGGILVMYNFDLPDTVYEIPNGMTEIGYKAFEGCTNLASVTIPASVTEIGSRAFWGCTNLTSVTIPASVTEIGASAFEGCTNLASVTIPPSVKRIRSEAFKGTACEEQVQRDYGHLFKTFF